ncbi:hypothetical protein C1X35_25745 [Pseudomonas sp. FW306-1C-G01A]|nr:hypothetical protein C1X56_14235 [Pseudomonas sp. GW101-1A09]PMV88110.1 hypothetical protein C1X51_26860 [Pseudomonas sp. FW306-2-2C-B10A]PMW00601.1 hypothetical protein C1X50_28110 [Pseudomonas sp. MPR-TSA4]PMW12554.1 hypothetical protein C1X52_19065 [Pseudomonas sp. FW306-2-1A-C05A]PMW29384.1 hypothetical protein C1X48_30075 [Pseudomonas sp. FW305-3-2-15-A-R2A1]PMW31399.1 hypothetical protein C1X49_27660 [Pseudomonas sp. MPR-E5]PMW47821.1 hypothetical protein C1X41_27460 [Pseudomonas sp.
MIFPARPISRACIGNHYPERQTQLNSPEYFNPTTNQNLKSNRFAEHWSILCLLLAPLAYFGYRYIADHVSVLAGAMLYYAYSIPIVYAPALVFLGMMFFIQKKVLFRELTLVGNFCWKDLVYGLSAVTILYVAVYLTAHLLGNPREPSMVLLYAFKTNSQIAILLFTVLLLPPIVEELLYRHFILTSVPVFKGKVTPALAILITAALFSLVHKYEYQLTYISLFLVGIIFGVARVRSKGLLLPIMLHMYAIGFVLLGDQVAKHIEIAQQLGR